MSHLLTLFSEASIQFNTEEELLANLPFFHGLFNHPALTPFWCFIIQEKGLEGEITRRTLTHTSWDLSSSKDRERRGWHPVTYKLSDATPVLIQTIKVCMDQVYQSFLFF